MFDKNKKVQSNQEITKFWMKLSKRIYPKGINIKQLMQEMIIRITIKNHQKN
jgi:hypothetical protein